MRKGARDQKEERVTLETPKTARLREELQSEAVIHRLVDTFRALGDPTRARIVFALSRDELRVGDLAELLEVTPSAASHQLRVLRNMNLVRYRRRGKMAYYSLDDEHIENLFKECLRHVRSR